MHCQCDCSNPPLPSPVEPPHFSHLPAYWHLVLLRIHWTITPCKRQNNGPYDVHVLISRTCECITLQGRRDFENVIKGTDLELGRVPRIFQVDQV